MRKLNVLLFLCVYTIISFCSFTYLETDSYAYGYETELRPRDESYITNADNKNVKLRQVDISENLNKIEEATNNILISSSEPILESFILEPNSAVEFYYSNEIGTFLNVLGEFHHASYSQYETKGKIIKNNITIYGRSRNIIKNTGSNRAVFYLPKSDVVDIKPYNGEVLEYKWVEPNQSVEIEYMYEKSKLNFTNDNDQGKFEYASYYQKDSGIVVEIGSGTGLFDRLNKGRHIVTNISSYGQFYVCPSESCTVQYNLEPAIIHTEILPGKSVNLVRYNDDVHANTRLSDSTLRSVNINFAKYDKDGFPILYKRNETSFSYDFERTFSTIITNTGSSVIKIKAPYEVYQISESKNPALKIMRIEPNQSIIFNNPRTHIWVLGRFDYAYYDSSNRSKILRSSMNSISFPTSEDYVHDWSVIQNIDTKSYEVYGPYNTFMPSIHPFPVRESITVFPGGGIIEIKNPYIEPIDKSGSSTLEEYVYNTLWGRWEWRLGIDNIYSSKTDKLIRNVGKNSVIFSWAYHASINGGTVSSGPSKISGIGGRDGIAKLDPFNINECSTIADPIDTASGAQIIDKIFLNTNCSVPIRLHLSYNSLLLNEGSMGKGWNHGFETKLNLIDSNNIELQWNSNRKNLFTLNGSQFVSNDFSTIYDKLQKNSDGTYSLERKDQTTYLFNNAGKLINIKYSNGNLIQLKYGENGELSEVIDPISSQKLTFYYNESGKVSKVSDALNRSVRFVYNNKQHLIEMFNENNEKTTYTYSEEGILLTGMSDEGTQLFENEYDEYGRVIKQKDALNNSTLFSYIEEENKITTIVKKRDGGQRALTHNNLYQLTEIQDELGNKNTWLYDSKGNLISTSDPLGYKTHMSYDDKGNLISLTDANGHITEMNYDNRNNLISRKDPLGNITFYSYDDFNNLLSITDPLGGGTRWKYDDANLPISKTDSDGATIFYSYQSGRLSSVTDPLGAVTSYEYDLAGRLVKAIDALGNATKFEYDDRGNLTKLTDKMGNVLQFSYNSQGDLLSHTDALGNVTTYTYNGNGMQTGLIDALNQLTQFEYDPEDRLARVTDPLIQTTSYRYDMAGRLTSYTDAKGNTSHMSYDSKGQLIRTTNTEGYQISYQYDPVGRIIRETDGDGNTTVRNYNENGQLVKVENSLGHITTYSYDANGNLRTFTDALGNITTYAYSASGNLIKTIDALGSETAFEYDKNGKIVKVVDANGNTIQYKYDLLGNLTSVIDPMGNSTTLKYDKNSNLISVSDAKGNIVYRANYDSLSRPIEVIDALGNTTLNSFDPLSRQTSILNAKGQKSIYEYDELSRLKLVIDSEQKLTTKISYDENDLITSIVDPEGNEQIFNYNKLGNILNETNSSGSTVRYNYNKKGWLIEQKNARGQNTIVEYDSLGRIISISNPEEQIIYSYDANGNLLRIQGAEGDISREYDKVNRVKSYTDIYGNTVNYSYDKVGNLTKLTYPDGKTVSYSYNKNGMLESVTDWQGRITTYQYDENSRLITTTRPNGTVETRSYDDKGQLIELKDLSNDGSVIVYDHFTYDAIGLVETEQRMNSVGSISSEDTVKMTYGADNRLETYNGENVSFDADGNMIVGPIQGSIQEFQYDSRNRLVHAGGLSYTYDSANQRVSINKGNETTRLVINPEAFYSQVLMETDENGNVMAYYVYGLGLISREDSDGNVQTYHYDRRGSTVALTDQQGSITNQYAYDTYGELVYQEGETENPFLYSGKYGVMTDDNGLYYMRARYYNPEIKRFINRDVILGNISDGQSLNRYAYVNGNPVSYVDPFGLSRDNDSYDYFIENTIIALAESVYYDTIGTFEAIINYEDTIKGIQQNIMNFSLKDTVESLGQYVVEFACADSERQAEMTGQLLSGFVGGPINKVNRFVPKRIGHLDAPMAGDNIGSMLRIDGKVTDEIDKVLTKNGAFRDAKRRAGIPNSTQHKKPVDVYDGTTENRRVYEFEVDGKKKYIIEHREDKFGRGPHFHGADDLKGSPLEKGRYNQYPGHSPEDFVGYKKKGRP